MENTHEMLSGKGTYILVLQLAAPCEMIVGRLGKRTFHKGFYYYVGSAFSSGGLEARLAHHARPSPSPRWHIDYLKNTAPVSETIVCRSPVHLEHEWASALSGINGLQPALTGFGSSDCRCRTHLFYSGTRRTRDLVKNLKPASSPEFPVIQIKQKTWSGWLVMKR